MSQNIRDLISDMQKKTEETSALIAEDMLIYGQAVVNARGERVHPREWSKLGDLYDKCVKLPDRG